MSNKVIRANECELLVSYHGWYVLVAYGQTIKGGYFQHKPADVVFLVTGWGYAARLFAGGVWNERELIKLLRLHELV